MTENTTRYWLMDWNGWMLDHDPLHDSFARRPFQPGRYPGVSFLVEGQIDFTASPTPRPAVVEKSVSLPRPFPPVDIVPTHDPELIALARRDRPNYVSCAPMPEPSGEVHYNATTIQGWEQYLPLTGSMLRGLAILTTPSASTVTDPDGEIITTFALRDPMTVQMGRYDFALRTHYALLTAIDALTPGQNITLPLTNQETGRDYSGNIKLVTS